MLFKEFGGSMSSNIGQDVPHPLDPTKTMYLYNDERSPTGVFVDSTSLASGHYLNTLILDKVYGLIVKMINALQDAAISLAGQLKVLTNWQKAYSEKMAQVHTFVALNGDPEYISGTGTDEGTIRQDLNQVGTTYTERMRSANSIVADLAKALQTSISQVQDSVTQQSNMATSIIGQFKEILASIFK